MARFRTLRSKLITGALMPAGFGLVLYLSDLVPIWFCALFALGSVPSIVKLVVGDVAQPASANKPPVDTSTNPGIDSVAPAIIDSLPDALIAIRRDRVVVETNKKSRELLGDGLRGRDISLSLRDDDALEAIDKSLANETIGTVDLSLQSPGSRFLTLQIIPFGLLADRDSRPTFSENLVGGAILVLHDTTAQRKSEQLRADFVANASHELRTPLASLVGFIETLQTSASEDPVARDRFLEIMARESGRMSRLIDDLLSLSRIEMDEHIRPTDRVDLGPAINSVAEVLEKKAGEKGMSLAIDLDEALPPVFGDHDQLMQVFQNLLDNAIKYGYEGSEIFVTANVVDQLAGVTESGIVVAVQNRGDVIPQNLLPRLTDRFYRIDTARSRSLGSTGLGLAIVKHIVGRHRGSFLVESDQQQGTVVSIGLPLFEPSRL
jgi:two-component system phosphate regulon sensor histidine kinase PhoR